jgi:CHAT domain-containing protein
MKQLFENWRGYVNEQEKATPEQIEKAEDFIEAIVAIVQAYEDTKPVEEAPGARARIRSRNRQRKKQMRINYIKRKAGIDKSIDIKDFTPEQQQMYDIARQEIKNQAEAEELATLDTIANGNILELPIIKQLYNAGGVALKSALGAAIGPECVDNLSLNCIATAVVQSGGAIMEETNKGDK